MVTNLSSPVSVSAGGSKQPGLFAPLLLQDGKVTEEAPVPVVGNQNVWMGLAWLAVLPLYSSTYTRSAEALAASRRATRMLVETNAFGLVGVRDVEGVHEGVPV